MEYEFNGKIEEGGEWDVIKIGGEQVADDCFDGEIVALTYYVSNSPINPFTAVEETLRTFYEGRCESDGTYMHGTSWTGCYGQNDALTVGGHDIIEELRDSSNCLSAIIR